MLKFLKQKDDPDFWNLWNTFLAEENPDCGVRYTKSVREYFRLLSVDRFISDESVVVIREGRPVAIAALFLENIGGTRQLSQFGESLPLPALSLKLAEAESKKIGIEVFRYIENFCRENQVERAVFIENPLQKMAEPFVMSYPGKHGWAHVPLCTSVIDLTRDLNDLRSEIRHSYRSLINKALKSCEFILYDHTNFTREIGERYRLMHHKAAGRVTRSQATFDKTYEWIERDEGYIIEQRHQGETVCFVVIMRAGSHLYYGSLADNPDLELEQGMMHGWVWFAIETFAKKQFKTIEMGHLIFGPQFGRSVSTKTVGISRFKSGYGGLEVPIGEYVWFANKNEAEKWSSISFEKYRESQEALEL